MPLTCEDDFEGFEAGPARALPAKSYRPLQPRTQIQCCRALFLLHLKTHKRNAIVGSLHVLQALLIEI